MDKSIINKNDGNSETIIQTDKNGTYKTTTNINEDGTFVKTTTYNYDDPGTLHKKTYSTSTGVGVDVSYFKGKKVGMSFSTDDPKIVCTFLAIFGLVMGAIGVAIAVFANTFFGICWITFVAWGIISEIIRVIKKNKK